MVQMTHKCCTRPRALCNQHNAFVDIVDYMLLSYPHYPQSPRHWLHGYMAPRYWLHGVDHST